MTFYSFKDDIYTNLTLENLTLQNKIDNKEKYQERFEKFVESDNFSISKLLVKCSILFEYMFT